MWVLESLSKCWGFNHRPFPMLWSWISHIIKISAKLILWYKEILNISNKLGHQTLQYLFLKGKTFKSFELSSFNSIQDKTFTSSSFFPKQTMRFTRWVSRNNVENHEMVQMSWMSHSKKEESEKTCLPLKNDASRWDFRSSLTFLENMSARVHEPAVQLRQLLRF